MTAALLETLRERLHLRTVLGWLGVLALVHFGFGSSLPQVATTAAVSGVVGLNELLSDAYDLRDSVGHAGVGVAAVVSGVGLLAFDEGAAWLPLGFVLVGGWFVLDAVQTVRHEGATEAQTTRDGREVYRDYVARRVHETVRERSLTPRELGDELDADDEDVEAAVERLRDRGAVERVGSELRPASDERGRLARVRERAATVARRIARPVTIEFGSDGRDDGTAERGPDRGDVHADRPRRAGRDDRGAPERASESETTERNRERETDAAGR
ncbi:MAG: MFS transporter [Haloarculaceae archaeon]